MSKETNNKKVILSFFGKDFIDERKIKALKTMWAKWTKTVGEKK